MSTIDLKKYVKPFVTLQTLEKIKQLFDMFDLDASGMVTMSELIKGIKSLGLEKRSPSLINLISSRKAQEQVDFQGFLQLMGFNKEIKQINSEQIFNQMDLLGKGFINLDDLKRINGQLNLKYSQAQLQEMIQAADIEDRDGYINFSQFEKVMKIKL